MGTQLARSSWNLSEAKPTLQSASARTSKPHDKPRRRSTAAIPRASHAATARVPTVASPPGPSATGTMNRVAINEASTPTALNKASSRIPGKPAIPKPASPATEVSPPSRMAGQMCARLQARLAAGAST